MPRGRRIFDMGRGLPQSSPIEIAVLPGYWDHPANLEDLRVLMQRIGDRWGAVYEQEHECEWVEGVPSSRFLALQHFYGVVPELPFMTSLVRSTSGMDDDTPLNFETLRQLRGEMDAFVATPGPVGFYQPRSDVVEARGELHETLVEFAKAGNRDDFYFLARSSGLQEQGDLDALWDGTRVRLRLPVI